MLVLVVLAVQDRVQMGHLAVRASHLETALKDIQARSFFAVALPSDAAPAGGGETAMLGMLATPVSTPLMYAPAMLRSVARPIGSPAPQIRFIDSEVGAQPGDLY